MCKRPAQRTGTGTVAENIAALKKSVETAARKAGRNPQDVRIVYVTKTVTPERIKEAFDVGAADFGENRVQELTEKKPQLPPSARWHMIGHLQTNKVKQVVGQVALIQSLDSADLAAEIERQAGLKGVETADCLIQVNSSGEKTKYGFAPQNVADFVSSLKPGRLRIKGLMTIGPLTDDAAAVREAFRSVRVLRDGLKQKFPQHGWEILSMGMSGDYLVAIEEGSTMIRVGSAVFGERK